MDEKVKFTEDSYEKALIDLFTELGYEYECGYDLGDRDEELPYYDALVLKCLQRLNPQLGETGIENLLNTVTYIEGGSLLQKNETFTKWLQNGVIVEDEVNGEYRNLTARIVDFDNVENNDSIRSTMRRCSARGGMGINKFPNFLTDTKLMVVLPAIFIKRDLNVCTSLYKNSGEIKSLYSSFITSPLNC